MNKDKVYIFDTTLRDGAQTEGVDFSVEDKNKIAYVLSEIGVDYKMSSGLADKPKIIETFDKAKDGVIAEIIAPGYHRRLPNDEYEVIVTAKVAIHVFKK